MPMSLDCLSQDETSETIPLVRRPRRARPSKPAVSSPQPLSPEQRSKPFRRQVVDLPAASTAGGTETLVQSPAPVPETMLEERPLRHPQRTATVLGEV